MAKNSTFFFIFDSINKENELYGCQELLETDKQEAELASLLDKIEFPPPDWILKRIFEEVY